LDEIIEVLKAGPPTFARLFSPLHRLRDIEPDPARREEVAELLDPLLTAENSSVRRSAQEAVKVWGTQKNVPTLLGLIDGRDNSDRWIAMEALGKIGGSQEAASKLASLMLDSRESPRARRALEDMGPLAEDAVWPIVGNGDNQVHSHACQVLGKIGTSKTLVKLKALRKDPVFGRQASIDSAIRNLEQRLRQRR